MADDYGSILNAFFFFFFSCKQMRARAGEREENRHCFSSDFDVCLLQWLVLFLLFHVRVWRDDCRMLNFGYIENNREMRMIFIGRICLFSLSLSLRAMCRQILADVFEYQHFDKSVHLKDYYWQEFSIWSSRTQGKVLTWRQNESNVSEKINSKIRIVLFSSSLSSVLRIRGYKYYCLCLDTIQRLFAVQESGFYTVRVRLVTSLLALHYLAGNKIWAATITLGWWSRMSTIGYSIVHLVRTRIWIRRMLASRTSISSWSTMGSNWHLGFAVLCMRTGQSTNILQSKSRYSYCGTIDHSTTNEWYTTNITWFS